jgi:aubergine
MSSSTGNGSKPVLGRGRGRSERIIGESRDLSEGGSKRPCQSTTGTSAIKRGSFRDSTFVSNAIFRTKPDTVTGKMGASGTKVQLYSNFFRLNTVNNFEYCQYRVNFTPDVDMLNIRRGLVGQLRNVLGEYIYDNGNLIYLTKRLPKDKNEFALTSKEGTLYKVEVNWTKFQIQETDEMALQILNVLLRRAMSGLKLQLVQRNLYDPKNKV